MEDCVMVTFEQSVVGEDVMIDDLIPDDIKQFIIAGIDSVAQLEALLLLRTGAHEKWEIPVVARRLYITEQETSAVLKRLCDQGLVMMNGNEPLLFQYRPKSVELARMIDRMAEVYKKQLVPVTNLIHSKPRSRIQGLADSRNH
jgi:hypothetical protein